MERDDHRFSMTTGRMPEDRGKLSEAYSGTVHHEQFRAPPNPGQFLQIFGLLITLSHLTSRMEMLPLNSCAALGFSNRLVVAESSLLQFRRRQSVMNSG